MSLRTIIYRRVSSDEQKRNNSPSAQQTDGLAYAEQHTMNIIDSLLEDFTGTTVDRPVFNRLLEIADAGMVDAVIVQHPDRLGRGPILELAIGLLARRGVQVHACNRGLISDEDDETAQIQNSVDGLVSGIERRNIRRRVTRGIVEKVTVKGQMPGYGKYAPYGYAWIGYRRDRTLVIDEETAQVVRRIYEWYDASVTVINICERLAAMRVPRPGVAHGERQLVHPYRWTPASLYRILRASVYGGTFYAFSRNNKQTKKKLHPTPVPVTVPSIIEPELFERVSAKLAVGRKYSQRNTKTPYLLRCRVRCGVCDSSMCGCTSRKNRYYRCGAVISKRTSIRVCDSRRFVAPDVEYTSWQWIEENVLHEENLREGITAKNAHVSSQRGKLQEEYDYYVTKIETIDREATRLKQGFLAGIFTVEEVAAEKRKLDDSRAKLEMECTTIERRIAGLGVSDEDARELLNTVREIKSKAQNLTEEGKRKIIDLCDVSIRLYLRDGAPWMHIHVQLTLQNADCAIVSHVV